MKLAIIGSRTFNNYKLLSRIMLDHYGPWDTQKKVIDWTVNTIISGCAVGADSLGAKFARDNSLELVEFPPDWEKHGKSAGYIRNKQIIDVCDEVLAFWNGKSKGTNHSLSLAKLQKKPSLIIYF